MPGREHVTSSSTKGFRTLSRRVIMRGRKREERSEREREKRRMIANLFHRVTKGYRMLEGNVPCVERFKHNK